MPREKELIALANGLGIAPWRLIVGVNNMDLYPNIVFPDYIKKRRSATRVEALLVSPTLLASFFGGMSKETHAWTREQLVKIRKYIIEQRERDRQEGRYVRKRALYP